MYFARVVSVFVMLVHSIGLPFHEFNLIIQRNECDDVFMAHGQQYYHLCLRTHTHTQHKFMIKTSTTATEFATYHDTSLQCLVSFICRITNQYRHSFLRFFFHTQEIFIQVQFSMNGCYKYERKREMEKTSAKSPTSSHQFQHSVC